MRRLGQRLGHLAHAVLGLAILAGIGYMWHDDPALAKSVHASTWGHRAAVGVVIALVLFVLVSLYRVIRPEKKPESAPAITSGPPPAPRKRFSRVGAR